MAQEAKHTAGPWVCDGGWIYSRGVSPTGMGFTDTVLKVDDPSFFPSESDARLIAAAPDLLEVLEALLDGPFAMEAVHRLRARDVIARARGRAALSKAGA